METKVLDYKLKSTGQVEESIVKVPEFAFAEANRLLCHAQVVVPSDEHIEGNEYTAVPGILDVLLEYGHRRVKQPIALDMVVLGVAEKIAIDDDNYRDLLQGIVDASRNVTEKYERRAKLAI